MQSVGGKWFIDEEFKLRFAKGNGAIVEVAALDIWSIEYEGLQIANEKQWNRPSIDLPELDISADLLQLELALLPGRNGGRYVTLRAVNALNRPFVDEWPTADQVILGHQWFPVDLTRVRTLADELRDHDISLLEELTEEMELWLLWRSGHEVAQLNNHREVRIKARRDFAPLFQHPLKAALYPYQTAGLTKMISMAEQGLGCLLADEMGLGKTLQAIGVIAWTVGRMEAPCLVVTPSSTTANWKREFDRFAPSLKVHEHAGTVRTGDPSVLAGYNVVITSYDLMLRDEYLLRSIPWASVVIDEAQNIKNPRTQRSQVIRLLSTGPIITITGTPIENSLTDLWSIMSVVAPDYLSSLDEFCSRYPDEVEAATELGRRVAPLVIRRRVAEVANDLPSRTDATVPIHPSDIISREYEKIRLDDSMSPLAKFGYLRQVCSSLRSIDPNLPPIFTSNPKYEHALQIIIDAFSVECKVLFFASFRSTLDEVEADLKERFPFAYVARLDGTVAIAERQRIIDEFSSFSGPAILVMNPKAAGVGLNIQAANYVIHFTPEWNPATIDQASARSHRRGQGKPVFVYSLFYTNSIEELMLERVAMKRELSKSGMRGAEELPSGSELQKMLVSSINGGT
ncbi:DEAD/DEAH box helicase [Paenarthrobacter sp. TA1.8]|uniref:DEAD/DEAH box helicase n=1 Tax=Paenarthrobacter sp. TA1.8 TaxID=3400219 RepID=UPI003B439ADA